MRDGLDADEVAARSMGWDHYMLHRRHIFSGRGDNPFLTSRPRNAWFEGWNRARETRAELHDKAVLEDYRIPRETKKDD